MSDEDFGIGKDNASGSTENAIEKDITRREVVKKAWVAPVVVAVNLPNEVFAQNAVSPVSAPVPPAPVAPPVAFPAPVSTPVALPTV